jgi:hypothetical protein
MQYKSKSYKIQFKNSKRANKYTFTKLLSFPTYRKAGFILSFNFNGVGAGSPRPSNCHCIERVGTVFRMKGVGSDIGEMV